jgi:hypothetical protein
MLALVVAESEMIVLVRRPFYKRSRSQSVACCQLITFLHPILAGEKSTKLLAIKFIFSRFHFATTINTLDEGDQTLLFKLFL